MKKTILAILMILLLAFSGLNAVLGQEQPKPKKDTVNMDTNAKPTYYYPVEDEKKGKSPVGTIAIVAGAVVVLGAAGFFILRKKK
jgi:hypothetical protein